MVNGTTTRLSTLMTTLMGPTIIKEAERDLMVHVTGIATGILIKKQETEKRSMV